MGCEEGRGSQNSDALKAAERRQIDVTRNNAIGADGASRGNEVIVIGIIGHQARHLDGFGQIDCFHTTGQIGCS